MFLCFFVSSFLHSTHQRYVPVCGDAYEVGRMFSREARWKSRWKIRDLFADPRCSQAILDFLATTQVGRRVPKPEEEDDAQSEASEWELREREERDEERRLR